MFKSHFLLAFLVSAIQFVQVAAGQQQIPGTSLVAVPLPGDMSNRSEAEVVWAFEDYSYNVLVANVNGTISVTDLLVAFDSFSASASVDDRCLWGGAFGRSAGRFETYENNGDPLFPDPDDFDAVLNGLDQFCNDGDDFVYMPDWLAEWLSDCDGCTCFMNPGPFGGWIVCIGPATGGDDVEDLWGGGVGSDSDGGGGGGDGGGEGSGGGGAGGGNPSPQTLTGSPPLRSDLQRELYTRGANAKTISSTLAANGWSADSNVDLRVELPGTDFELRREYSNGSMLQNYSEAMPWVLGRGWQTSAQSWVRFRYPDGQGLALLNDIDNMGVGSLLTDLEIRNFPVSGSTKMYPDVDLVPDPGGSVDDFDPVFRSGGGGSSTIQIEIVEYFDAESGGIAEVQAFVQRKAGGGIRVYYFHNLHYKTTLGEPDPPLNELLNGYILYEEDEFGNRWNYAYTNVGLIDNGVPDILEFPFLNAIYLQGTNVLDSKSWIRFVWDIGTDQNPGDGHLMRVESRRRFGDRDIVVDKVVYKNASDVGLPAFQRLNEPTPTNSGVGIGSDNLVQVEKHSGINLPSDGRAFSSSDVQFYTRVYQYRYTGYDLVYRPDDPDGTTYTRRSELLAYEFAPETFEWLVENGSGASNVIEAASSFMATGINDTIIVNGSDTVKPLDFAESITEFYSNFPLHGKVQRRWMRKGAGRGMTAMLEYDYARAYVENWNPYPLGHEFVGFDAILKPRRYSTRIKEFIRPGTRTDSLEVNPSIHNNEDVFMGSTPDWTHNKTTYHWSEDVIMHEFALKVLVDGGAEIPFLRRFRTPVTVATGIMEPGWSPTSTDKKAWFTFTKYRNDLTPSMEQGAWIRENGQELQLLHPSALDAPELEQISDTVVWVDDPNDPDDQIDIPYMLKYGGEGDEYVMGSTGFMAANASTNGGFSERWEYDSLNRLTKSFEERVSTINTPDGLVIVNSGQSHLLEERAYKEQSDNWGDRSDLLEKITYYRTDSGSSVADDIEVVEYNYVLESLPFQADDRVSGVKTTLEREGITENGPGGDVFTYQAFDEHGDTAWSYATDDVLTVFERDLNTGVVTKKITGAETIPSQYTMSEWADELSPASTLDPLESEFVVDISGSVLISRNSSGIESRIGYFYDTIFGSSSAAKYLAQVTVPHIWNNGTELAGPISIEWVTADGRSVQSRDYIQGATDPVIPLHTTGASALDMATLLQDFASNSYDQVSQFEQQFDENAFLSSYREWHDLDGSLLGGGLAAFYEYQYQHDALGRPTTTVFPDGTLEEIASYDVRDRSLEVFQGVAAPPETNLLLEYFYDSGNTPEQGVGDGLLSWTVVYPGDGTKRNTRNIYDWRNRQVISSPPIESSMTTDAVWDPNTIDGPIQAVLYDNLGRVVESATFDSLSTQLYLDITGSVTTELVDPSVDSLSRSLSMYSQSGSVYRTATALEPNSITTGWLVSNAWFDDAGRTLTLSAPGVPVQKNVYDSIGRLQSSLLTNGTSIKSNASLVGINDQLLPYSLAVDPADVFEEILQQTSYFYFDSAAQVGSRHQIGIKEVAMRNHDEDAAAVGLGTKPIRTYTGSVFDPSGRSIAAVNFGTNTPAGTAGSTDLVPDGPMPALMTSVPLRDLPGAQQTKIISEVEYNGRGLVHAVTDPLERRSTFLYDPLGRSYASIENVHDPVNDLAINWNSSNNEWVVGTRPASNPDQNRVTSTVFDSNGNSVKRTAHQPSGLSQSTEYVYTKPGSALAENNAIVGGLLYEIRYPDPDTGLPSSNLEDKVQFGYNRIGEQLAVQDQNGTKRSYQYDVMGRLESESVVAAAPEIDQAIMQKRTQYDEFGRIAIIESFDTIGGTLPVNGVSYTYDPATNDLVQLDQTVDNNSITKTLKWVYDSAGYSTENGNRKRLQHIEYPDGTQYSPEFGVSESSDDLVNRISGYSVTEPGTSAFDLVMYSHIGVGTVAITDHLKGNFQMDRTVGDNGQRRYGLDTSASLGHYAGWDRFGRLKSQSWVRTDSTVNAENTGPDRMELFKENYAWNQAGNLLTRTDVRWHSDLIDRDWDIRYDGLNRAVEARRGEMDSNDEIAVPQLGTQTWVLDQLGNWDSTDIPGLSDQARLHNENNELTNIDDSITGVSRVLSYDNNGNLTQVDHDEPGTVLDRTVSYQYDAWNRLVRVLEDGATHVEAVHVEFEYNPLHWRVAKRVNTDFADENGVFNGFEEVRVRTYSPSWQMLEEEIETDGTHVGAERVDAYFWGKRHSDEILSKRKTDYAAGTTTTQWWHYVTDNLFSVRAVISGTGGHKFVHERVEYDAYGRPKIWLGGDVNQTRALDFFDISDFMASYNNTTDPDDKMSADLTGNGQTDFFDLSVFLEMFNSQAYRSGDRSLSDGNLIDGPDNTIGYAGYHWDQELGMWLSRHRVFDPELGRWMQRDPAGYIDGMSMYAYVNGNPFAFMDPTGLFGFKDAMSVAGAYYGEILSETVDLVVDTATGISDVAVGVYDVARGEGDTTVLGQIATNMMTDGVGETLGTMRSGVADAAGDHFDKVMSGDLEAIGDTFTGFGSAIMPGAGALKAVDNAGDVGKIARVANAVVPDVPKQFRDANGRLRNSNGTFAPDGGSARRTSGGTNGNIAGNQPATLYERYDADGIFQKHGVSQDPSKRYTDKELGEGFLIEKQTGPRKEMLKAERELVETNPGPLNKEPWAGKRSDE